jgi:hypothetical protein
MNTLCEELSLSLAELKLLCFKIGIDVFTLDSTSTLSSGQAQLIRARSIEVSPRAVESTQSPKQFSPRKTTRSRTAVEFASEFDLTVTEVLELCRTLGFSEVDEERRLSRRQILQLSNHLLQNEINLIYQDDARSTTALGSILDVLLLNDEQLG